jgi:hypothetical protein
MAAYSLVKILKPGINGRLRPLETDQSKDIYDCEPVWFPGGTLMLELRRVPRLPKWRELMFDGKTYLVPRWGFCEVELSTTGEDDDDSESDSQ